MGRSGERCKGQTLWVNDTATRDKEKNRIKITMRIMMS